MFGDNHRYLEASYYLLLLYNCVAHGVFSLSNEKTVAGWVNRRHGG
jgi:hypothetical protein